VVFGGAGDDLLDGGSGRDILKGNAGADTIEGGDDNHRISGGLGQDRLTGGDTKDRIIYGSVDHSLAGAGDTITDFKALRSRYGHDTPDLIHLLRIDADATTAGTNEAFAWIADAVFTGTAGELRYEVTGADALVQADIDGDGLADREITLLGVTTLAETGFVL
jgi:Ca2+-binding RTX toxin-like protein